MFYVLDGRGENLINYMIGPIISYEVLSEFSLVTNVVNPLFNAPTGA